MIGACIAASPQQDDLGYSGLSSGQVTGLEPPTDSLKRAPADLRSVGGTVASQSSCDLQGPFRRGFEPRHRRPGLKEDLKA
ncbi:hypothetical protein PoB_005414400 [Plakobranchus ocellatus]|uniref:Uncharacterized protein n=1 Tax=Plakobranchus ocellatus TaxID=259542 RepID=A0AAV4C996_9GAST|nr:hypothetical protein PoB_005414400 [Plakobranchus ocellatus]